MKGGDCYEELSLDPLPKTLSMEKRNYNMPRPSYILEFRIATYEIFIQVDT
jgi:hypothetical protein